MSDAPVLDRSKPFTRESAPVLDRSKPFTREGAVDGGERLVGGYWQSQPPSRPLSESAPTKTGIARYLDESIAGLSDAAKTIGPDAASLAKDLLQGLLPTEEGARAGGRAVGKIGDVAAFATGGFGGPEGAAMPREAKGPTTIEQIVGREIEKVTPAAKAPPAPSPAASRYQDFKDQGITPSVPVVGQGMASGLAAQAGRVLPFSPVGKRIEQNVGEAQAASERAASQYGEATPEQGGAVTQNALKGYAADKTAGERNYKEFWNLMQGAPKAPVTRTLGVLDQVRGRFPNAPELKDIWPGSSQIGTMQRALTPRTETIPAKTSAILDQSGRPTVTSPAQTVQRGGVLSIPELKELKTKVGSLLENAVPGETSIPRGQVKQLYGAVKADLMAAAAAKGPQAAQALVKADANFSLRMGVLDRLAPMLAKDAPEAVWTAINQAAGAGKGDVGLLRTAKRIMAPDDWKNVGAAMIRRLGAPMPGVPRAPGQPEFSVGGFSTNWRKMSDKAKDVIFGDDVYGSPRAGLEQLYRVTSSLQNAQRLGNTSNTYNIGVTAAAIEAVFLAIQNGHLPLKEMGALGGAYGLSKALMSPRLAKILYEMPKTLKPGGSMADTRDALLAKLAPAISPAARTLGAAAVGRPRRDPEERHSVGAE